MRCDAAAERLHSGREALLAGDIDDVLADIEVARDSFLTASSSGTNQRPFRI